ncbi:MAG: multicomponent Na+:H+ antiporter subunit [Streptosporangiaceae bacterium]|nr:mrpB [Streptosporangiaceae bacterium]MDX6433219.1 multicomponent Na+:H+ antiporter subunit [Streptosporangiaceae bacterium]
MSRPLRMVVFWVGGIGVGVLFVLAAVRLPGFGGDLHPYGARAVSAGLARHTPNIVSSINFDQRALDTVGEELILLAAALGAVLLLRTTSRESEESARHYGPAEIFDLLRLTGYVLLPVGVVTGIYIVAHGYLSPGGGFQGGVVLGSAIHLVYLAGDYPALARVRPLPLFEGAEALAAGAFVVLGLGFAGQVTPMNAAVGLEVGCAVVLVLAKFFEQALVVRSAS